MFLQEVSKSSIGEFSDIKYRNALILWNVIDRKALKYSLIKRKKDHRI